MSATLSALAHPCLPPSPDPVASRNAPTLNWLRLLFRACRAKARLDLFHACAMLASDRSTSAQAYADALLRALSSGSARALIIHAPGEAAMSFDERWLVSLIDAVRRGDGPSRDFLLRSRLPRADRRQIGWLATRLVELSPTETLGHQAA